jgi:hypothetical protein
MPTLTLTLTLTQLHAYHPRYSVLTMCQSILTTIGLEYCEENYGRHGGHLSLFPPSPKDVRYRSHAPISRSPGTATAQVFPIHPQPSECTNEPTKLLPAARATSTAIGGRDFTGNTCNVHLSQEENAFARDTEDALKESFHETEEFTRRCEEDLLYLDRSLKKNNLVRIPTVTNGSCGPHAIQVAIENALAPIGTDFLLAAAINSEQLANATIYAVDSELPRSLKSPVRIAQVPQPDTRYTYSTLTPIPIPMVH